MNHQASTTMAPTHSYSSMSRQEIISVLRDCKISDSDLQNPTPDFVFNLYNFLLHHHTFQDDTILNFAVMAQLDNPVMHAYSVRVMMLYTHITYVLERIKCPLCFTLDDLIHPDSNRTVNFLGPLTNYFLHRSARFFMISTLKDRSNFLEEQRKQKESNILQLKNKKKAIEAVKEREMPLENVMGVGQSFVPASPKPPLS